MMTAYETALANCERAHQVVPVVVSEPLLGKQGTETFRLSQIAKAGRAFGRGFDAARMDRHTEGWYGDFGISQWDIRHQLRVVRNRARETWKNDQA